MNKIAILLMTSFFHVTFFVTLAPLRNMQFHSINNQFSKIRLSLTI